VAKLIKNIRDLADVEEIEKTPLSARDLPNSGYDAIARWAEKTPDKVAIYGLRTGTVDEEPSMLTYRELFQQMNQFANLMHSLGVGPEDAISLLLPIIP
jgi:fatty-acyl-CoA synthase